MDVVFAAAYQMASFDISSGYSLEVPLPHSMLAPGMTGILKIRR